LLRFGFKECVMKNEFVNMLLLDHCVYYVICFAPCEHERECEHAKKNQRFPKAVKGRNKFKQIKQSLFISPYSPAHTSLPIAKSYPPSSTKYQIPLATPNLFEHANHQ